MIKAKNRAWLIPVIIIISTGLVIIGFGSMFAAGSFSFSEDTPQFLEIFIGIVGIVISVLLARSEKKTVVSPIQETAPPAIQMRENKQSGTGNINMQDFQAGGNINVEINRKDHEGKNK